MRKFPDVPLFCSFDWPLVEEGQKNKLQSEIDNIEENKFLNMSIEDLCDFLEEKFRFDIPKLHEKEIIAEPHDIQIDVRHDPEYFVLDRNNPHNVPGTLVEVTIPFSGDQGAFRMRPTRHTIPNASPWGEIRDSGLVIKIEGTNLESQQVREEIEQKIEEIKKYISWLHNDAHGFNEQLRQLANELINRRRQKLLDDRKLVAELGFLLKKRPDAPQTYTTPNVRRRIVPTMPPASKAPFEPEPVLHTDDYEHILSVMTNMVSVMERSPSEFSAMKEETLRSHFLVQLNGHYEGQATGETFNYKGKTDILIRDKGRNIFIAECKYWSGEKQFTKTIDQLLRYLSWRDTKAAIVVFNRNKNFSRILRIIPDAVKAHSKFKRALDNDDEGRSRYILAHRDDKNREIILTVLAFDVPRRTE